MEINRAIAVGLGFIGVGCSFNTTNTLNLSLEQANSVSESILQQQCQADDAFTWVSSGNFIYGSDRAERDYAYQISALAIAESPEAIAQAEQRLHQRRWFESEPQKQVRSLPGFCMQKNLVTNADYQQFIHMTGHRSPNISAADYQTQGFLVHPYETVKHYRWNNQTYPDGTGPHPVVLVSYNDALAYAQWKGVRDQAQYRLPTAEEWEKAARGTDGRYFPWGDEWVNDGTNWARTDQVTRHSSHDDSSRERGLQQPGTSAIATFPLSQSIYGVHDMAGNVFEYTSTLRNRQGKTRSVMKGCSWDDLPGFCRSAYAHTRPIDSRHILFGFRLIKN